MAGVPANLVEIFSSVQGEGPHVGARTLFIRFGECDLRCRWCDSPGTWRPATRCRIAEDPLGSSHEWLDNPVDTETVVSACERLDLPRHDFVSLTGGEPLLQPIAVSACARALRLRGPRILLETHGLCWQALPDLVDAVDVVSMDWKLRSDVRRASDPKRGPVPGFEGDHERFLRAARRAPGLVVKLVVTPASGGRRDRRGESLCGPPRPRRRIRAPARDAVWGCPRASVRRAHVGPGRPERGSSSAT